MKKAKRHDRSGILRKILLSKPFCITVMVIMALLAFICLIRVILGFMPIKNFTVEGDTHYDIVDIINAADIRSGDKLYKINKKASEQKIVKNCPYIKTVKIKQKFPNTVCFVVEEQDPGWYIKVGKSLYGLDPDMKILLETFKEDDFIERGLTELTLPELESVVVGELPDFASDDEHTMTETLKIIYAFRTHDIKARLTGLDISNRFEIKLEIDNAYVVHFGDMASFDIKMELLEGVLDEAKKKNLVSGTITYEKISGTFALQGEYGDPDQSNGEESTEKNGENDIID